MRFFGAFVCAFVWNVQIFGFPVASAEDELFQKSHLLEGVGCEAVRPGHVQNLLDAAGRLVVEPVAAAVAEPREVTFGGEDGHVHIFAFAIPCGYFFACEHERHDVSVFVFAWECGNLFAEFLESRDRRVRFFCKVFLRERKIVGVVGAIHEIEPDGFSCQLQHFWRGAVFHMVGGIMRVAVHLARGVARSDGRVFVQNFKAERSRLESGQVPALEGLRFAFSFDGQFAIRFVRARRDFTECKRNKLHLLVDFDVQVFANDFVLYRRGQMADRVRHDVTVRFRRSSNCIRLLRFS